MSLIAINCINTLNTLCIIKFLFARLFSKKAEIYNSFINKTLCTLQEAKDKKSSKKSRFQA